MSPVLEAARRGNLFLESRRCGKPNCRCARGLEHGPYAVLRWREGGKQYKRHVRDKDVPAVLAAIAERRARAPVSQIRLSLRRAGA